MGEDCVNSSQFSSGFPNTGGRGVPPSQALSSARRGGLRYASPARCGKRMDQGRVRTNYSAIPDTYRGQ